MKEWNLEKHHRAMIQGKLAASQRKGGEGVRKEAELQRATVTGHGSAPHANHPLVHSTAPHERVSHCSKKAGMKNQKKGIRLKISRLKSSRWLGLTRESLERKTVGEAIFILIRIRISIKLITLMWIQILTYLCIRLTEILNRRASGFQKR
jgi:hypothetical protein